MWKKIKEVFSCVREYKKFAIITPLCMIGEAAMETAIPAVMSWMLNDIPILIFLKCSYILVAY